ncbi:hypothetical protein BDB01DRAFT_606769 [Pilobolus umbonatus]|nr:hypothetical protein BDB01DRAFT_606769 [Pilobolus umbonatus]
MSRLILLSLLMLVYCELISSYQPPPEYDYVNTLTSSDRHNRTTTGYSLHTHATTATHATHLITHSATHHIVSTSTPSSSAIIHSVSNTGSAQQKKKTMNEEIDDPNSEGVNDEVRENIEKDQSALKRVILILGLVGGLGVLAVITTLVIFTRVKYRNKKRQEEEEEGIDRSTYAVSNGVNQSLNEFTFNGNHNNSSNDSNSNDDNSNNNNDPPSIDDRISIEPSAPPALLMSILEHNTNRPVIDYTEPVHQVVTSSSQTSAPTPSAPTAKELDVMLEGEASREETYSRHHSLDITDSPSCSRCYPLVITPDEPEVPPPAYTPSAPPHYDLPPESSTS